MNISPPANALACVAVAVAAFLPAVAAAEPQRCGEREKVIRHLESRYGETQRSVGLQEGRGVVEIYANDDSGSWTILLTTPEGTSCLMAAGQAWQTSPPTVAAAPI